MKINELFDGWSGNITLLVGTVATKTKKDGGEYLDVVCMDSTGSIICKVWRTEDFVGIDEGKVVECRSAKCQSYNGTLQLTCTFFSILNDEEVEKYLPCSKYTKESMLKALDTILNKVENRYCKQLLSTFRDDEEFMKRFCKHGAGQFVHGAYVGGLLEHSLRVTQIAYRIAMLYSNVNKDLVITAAFLHDIGKLEEFTCLPNCEYSDEGNYLGHITIGAIRIAEVCDTISDFPDDIKLKIIHCILSHHGKLEYGAPKLPAIPEAFIISEADMIDSRINIFERSIVETGWSERNYLLGTCVHSGHFKDE